MVSCEACRNPVRPEQIQIQNFVDGQFVGPIGGKYLDNIEPATGNTYSLVPDSDSRDVELAVAAAERAFPEWSGRPAAERSRILLRIADLIERDLEKFARAESVDTGKPLSLARSLDIPRASSNFRFFATAILHTENEAHMMDGVAFNYTLRQPRGIVGLISPWNLPLYLLSWKIAPAIAVGNTAVAKPSELTPMTAYLLGEVCREAGLPNGVLNIVQGPGPRLARPSRRIRRSGPSRSRAARSRDARWRKRARPSLRKCHSNLAEKTRTSFSPMPTSMPPSQGASAHPSPIRDRFVCAARASLWSGLPTTNSSGVLSRRLRSSG